MPNELAHIQLAIRNQGALDHLLSDPVKFSEWIATTAFYKALQVVEAVLTHNRNNPHGNSHAHRAQILKERKYSHIWKHYRLLWSASTIARYLKDSDDGNGKYDSFDSYLPAARVVSELVGNNLRQVEKSAQLFLSGEAQKALGLTPRAKKKRKRRRGTLE